MSNGPGRVIEHQVDLALGLPVSIILALGIKLKLKAVVVVAGRVQLAKSLCESKPLGSANLTKETSMYDWLQQGCVRTGHGHAFVKVRIIVFQE